MMLKIFKFMFYAAFVALLVWFCASYVDIVSDNIAPNPQHAPWNMFVLFS